MQIFPEFKKLEWSNREEAKQFTGEFPSSSDFNFIIAWSRRISKKMRLSLLNKNPEAQFHNYVSETCILYFWRIILVQSTIVCRATNFNVNIHPHIIIGKCVKHLHHVRFVLVVEGIKNKSMRKGREPP